MALAFKRKGAMIGQLVSGVHLKNPNSELGDDQLRLSEEADEAELDSSQAPWRVLIVDDNKDVHTATRLALGDLRFEGRDLEFVSVYSAAEAINCLDQDEDFAVMFLDVVMEDDHAGFRVLDYLRDSLSNDSVRVILRTGQPGQAPPLKVVMDYDINDYRSKADLTFEKLTTCVCTALRMHRQIGELKAKQRELEELNEKLNQLSRVDPLTGIANRRVFDETLQAHWLRYQRLGVGIAVVMIDVDHFKSFNDALGHQAGDQCLKQIADILAGHIKRSDDVLARYGGEEFVALLTDVDARRAFSFANDMVRAVREAAIDHPKSQSGPFVTISAGVSAAIPSAHSTPYTLLSDADRALYQAKAAGRARAECSSIS